MKAIVARSFAPLDRLEYADWPEPEAAGSTVVIATVIKKVIGLRAETDTERQGLDLNEHGEVGYNY